MTAWQIAIREIWRNPLRSLLMAIGVALAAGAMTAVTLLVVGVHQGIERTVGRLGADLMVVPKGEEIAREFNQALITGRPATFYLNPSTVRRLSAASGIASASPQTFVETLTNARCCAGKFFIVGFSPKTDFTVLPWLRDNTSAPPPDSENWMIVGDRILLRAGQTAQFYGTTFSAAGVLEPTGTGMDWTIYVPDAALRRMIGNSEAEAERPLRIKKGAASAVFVKALPDTDLIDLAERIEQDNPNVQAILSSTVAGIARRQVRGIAASLCGMVGAIWVMALILSGVLFSQSVRERRGELGLLMAKGAHRPFLLGLLAREAAAVAAASSAAGCVLGMVVIASFRQLLSHALGAADVMPSAGVAAASLAGLVVLMTASAVAAALAPTLHLLRMEPYAALCGGKTA